MCLKFNLVLIFLIVVVMQNNIVRIVMFFLANVWNLILTQDLLVNFP